MNKKNNFMYWIFLIMFIITIMVPDIISGRVLFLSENHAEEVAIFLMGAVGFLIFIKNEQEIIFQKKEKEIDQKKIKQTVKDLVESYGYIGEVNRKMDLLMNIALGLTDRSMLSKTKENEIYRSIISAAKLLFKAKNVSLRFIDVETKKTKKEIQEKNKHSQKNISLIKNEEIMDMKKRIAYREKKKYLFVSSTQEVNKIKSFIIVYEYNLEEESNPKDIEILKLFASQSLFVYSFMHDKNNCNCNS